MAKLLYFESVPPQTSYFPGNLASVPDHLAEEWIFNGHCINAEKVLDPDPFFNPSTVAKLQSNQLEKFIDEKQDFIQKQIDRLSEKGRQLKELSEKINQVSKRKDKEDIGTFNRVKIQKQLSALENLLDPMEEEIDEISNEIQLNQIDLWNAQVRFISEFVKDFKSHKSFDGLDKLLQDVEKKNTEIKNAFSIIRDRFHVGFMPEYPFLPEAVFNKFEQTMSKRNEILDDVAEKISAPIKSKISTAYKESFINMLQKKGEENEE